MKKQNISNLFKGRGFYLSLFTGVCAVCAIALVCFQSTTSQNDNNLVDLNEPIIQEGNSGADANQIQNSGSDETADNSQNADASTITKADASEQVELEGYEEDKGITSNVASNPEVKAQVKTEEKVEVEEETAAVMKSTDTGVPEDKDSEEMSEESGISWPVEGPVLMQYSADQVTYFKTLEQYKCNPALLIQANVGTDVKCSSDGKVENVQKDDENGTMVTISIGDDYKLVYGQLDNVSVEKGDSIKEGAVIAQVAEPTKYFTKEGSHLYFQILQSNEPVDPYLLLK